MPSAADHQSAHLHKILYIGDSGTGKTTSLFSLLALDYQLRIFDFDNLLDPLIALTRSRAPERLNQIQFMSFRDSMKATPMGPIIDGQPKAFIGSLQALDKWEDGTNPQDWGPKHVAVIDSHTTQARAAYFWARGMQGAAGLPEGISSKGVEPRAIFFTAQQAVMNCIALLTGAQFNTNVIVIAHIKYLEHGGNTKGYPLSVGTAISPEIPTYFPSVALATKSASGNRVIRTRSTLMIDLKDPKTFDPTYADELPMDTGLAEIFK
jgi:hypothetical protein